MNLIELLLISLGIYLGLGLLIGCIFLLKGVHKIDQTASDTSLGFKLVILPGLAMLWPIMLVKWSKA